MLERRFSASMQQIAITLPGEAGVVALATLFTELVKDLTPQEKQILTDRFITLSEPYYQLQVAINKNIAAFLAKLLKIDIAEIK